jgi:3-dehydroquinate synthase
MEPNIYLYGPPGSGKSAAGKALAGALDLPFIDLDLAIEQAAGKPIPAIMAETGEAGFRDWESRILGQALAQAASPSTDYKGSVVALGGGALLRAENRRLAESTGRVVCLMADRTTLEQRLAADPVQRPLLVDCPSGAGEEQRQSRLEALLAVRGEHYASFAPQVPTGGRSPQQVAGEIQIILGRFRLRGMSAGTAGGRGRGYDALIESGGLDALGERLRARLQRPPEAVTAVVVTDEHVAPLYAGRAIESLRQAGFRTGPAGHRLVLPPGEAAKTLESATRLWRGFLAAGMDRRGLVVALGGGVIGDLSGFAASTFLRGVDWAAVPTTLLAMVDASLGGKTGVDLPEGKNLVGSFHPPCLVLSDPQVLATLPPRELAAGLAEVVKHGLIADPELYRLCGAGLEAIQALLPEVIARAAAVKVHLVEEDPFEGGVRAALNLGHTTGHAVETASNYRLLHGEAVAIGLVVEARLAERLGIARPGLADELVQTLASLGLPTHVPVDLRREELVRLMGVDKKKASGVVRFALPAEIGRVQVGVEVADLGQVFLPQVFLAQAGDTAARVPESGLRRSK